MQISGISVIIPAYNEEKYLPNTLKALKTALGNSDLPVEILVVDNNSTDRTVEVAEKYGARVISHELRNIASV